jgi:hypothetical protein
MRTRAELALQLLQHAEQNLRMSLNAVTLDEALQAGGGYRSVLGILKHTAGWSWVYRSYAFDAEPRHWAQTSWPRGLRDTIEPSQSYFDEVAAWMNASCDAWRESVARLADETFDEPRRMHWDGTMPLFDIITMNASHWVYHAGEINAVVAIIRGHAWEYSEEVEENHISTAGHRLRPNWMSDDQASKYEAYISARDRQLHPD